MKTKKQILKMPEHKRYEYITDEWCKHCEKHNVRQDWSKGPIKVGGICTLSAYKKVEIKTNIKDTRECMVGKDDRQDVKDIENNYIVIDKNLNMEMKTDTTFGKLFAEFFVKLNRR